MRALVLHDQPGPREQLAALLRNRGHEVTALAEPRAALAAHGSNAYPLVLLGGSASGPDGVAVCRLLRSPTVGVPPTGVVVVIRRDQLAAAEPVLAAGAMDVLTEPFDAVDAALRMRVVERTLGEWARQHALEEALRESEARLLALSQATFEALAFSEDGRIVDCNEHMAAMLRSDVATLIGANVLDFAAPESRAVVLANIRAGDTRPYEVTGLRADGTTFLAELSGKTATYKNRVVCVTALRDITAHRAAETALRASEQSLAATLRSIGDAVIATDAAARVVRMNPVAERLTGWSLGDAVGRPLGDVFRIASEGSDAPVEGPATRVLREGPVVGLANHTELLARDGVRRPIADSGAPIFDAAGTLTGVVLVFRDMTEERRATQALERSQQEFRHVIASIPQGIAILRDDGRIVFANPALARCLGYAHHDALLGRAILEVLGLDGDGESNATGPALQAELRGEIRRDHRDGHEVILELAPGPAIEFDGRPAQLLVMRDVTERSKLLAQLHVADRMISIGTLAAGVAHEINNPLAYVTTNLSYVLQQLRKVATELADPRLRRTEAAVKEAQDGVARVGQIVRDLKTLSRGDDERRGPVDVRTVLESSLSMATNEIRHRARLVRDYLDVPPVDANEGRLGQVFLNLLVNAAQAIPEGHADANEIRVATRVDARGRCVVEVRDTGDGIPRAALSRIFDPFFTTKAVGEGTGLGLSICHGIVTALGGEITAESTPGVGTTFRVALPAALADGDACPARDSVVPTPRRSRILVLDDEPLIGTSIGRILEEAHDVVALTSTREALDRLLAGEQFDLIFCDLMMPQMTGMDFYAELRRALPAVVPRVVFLTGGAFTPRARAFLDDVPNARLEKPFDAAALEAVIRAQLR